MDFVDLQRRREDRARTRRKPEASRRRAARDPLFLLITGFAAGSLASFVLSSFLMGSLGYLGPTLLIFLAVISLLVPLCYAGWRFSGRDDETITPKLGSEKQLLMAIQDADGGITPVEAALETSLTVDEAEEILTRFADRGHLIVQIRDGALFYTLPGGRLGARTTPGT